MPRNFWGLSRVEGDCLIWLGGISPDGYGRCERSGQVGAHRVAWLLRRGFPAAGRLENNCGNRLCVNPDHWRECVKTLSVERVPKRVEVRRGEIERLWREGRMITDIAEIVGVSRVTVWRAIRGLRE